MAQRTPKSTVRKPKARYRVENWREYNRALVARGSITLWIDEAVLAGWRAAGGKGWRCSDMAILAARSLRAVFGIFRRRPNLSVAVAPRLRSLTDLHFRATLRRKSL
jgi:hypothetical protein